MADPEAVFDVAERVEADAGPIDIWVNMAFASVFAPFDQIRPHEYRRVTEVCYLGYVYATRAALEHMKPRNRGTIVQVGSALAYRGIPLQTAYCGAKHAIQGFHESLRCELLHERSNVRVTMVQMPGVRHRRAPNAGQPATGLRPRHFSRSRGPARRLVVTV
jgi:NAD(P)-dependent dehydrogenase (short-subunit alcohol dehydrogenase family)